MKEKKQAVSVGLGTYAGEPAAAAPEQCQPERDTAPKNPLTHKQQLFVEYYLKFLNSVEAAIAAGYTPENARTNAYRLMANEGIKAAIEKRMVERISIIGVDHTLVLIRLVAELKADVADLFNDNGSIKDVHEWPLVWRQGLVAGIEVYEEFDLQNEGGKKKKVLIGLTKKVRFADRTKRLELFGKHTSIRAFSDKKTEDDKGYLTAASILAQLKPTAVRPREDDPE